MILCLCNPFSDKKVKELLKSSEGKKARVSEVYGHCSNGQSPQCCSCLETLKDMVKDHNKALVPASIKKTA